MIEKIKNYLLSNIKSIKYWFSIVSNRYMFYMIFSYNILSFIFNKNLIDIDFIAFLIISSISIYSISRYKIYKKRGFTGYLLQPLLFGAILSICLKNIDMNYQKVIFGFNVKYFGLIGYYLSILTINLFHSIYRVEYYDEYKKEFNDNDIAFNRDKTIREIL